MPTMAASSSSKSSSGSKSSKSSSGTKASGKKLLSVDFEVFGKVQGVFFRKYTRETALKLGLAGWVENTEVKTVVGTVQGPADRIAQMKTWLKTKGSPKSRIDRCVFKNEKEVNSLTYESFDVRK